MIKQNNAQNYRVHIFWGICSLHIHIWGLLCQKQVSRVYSKLWDVTTYLCPRYLLLVPKSTYTPMLMWLTAMSHRRPLQDRWCHSTHYYPDRNTSAPKGTFLKQPYGKHLDPINSTDVVWHCPSTLTYVWYWNIWKCQICSQSVAWFLFWVSVHIIHTKNANICIQHNHEHESYHRRTSKYLLLSCMVS